MTYCGRVIPSIPSDCMFCALYWTVQYSTVNCRCRVCRFRLTVGSSGIEPNHQRLTAGPPARHSAPSCPVPSLPVPSPRAQRLVSSRLSSSHINMCAVQYRTEQCSVCTRLYLLVYCAVLYCTLTSSRVDIPAAGGTKGEERRAKERRALIRRPPAFKTKRRQTQTEKCCSLPGTLGGCAVLMHVFAKANERKHLSQNEANEMRASASESTRLKTHSTPEALRDSNFPEKSNAKQNILFSTKKTVL